MKYLPLLLLLFLSCEEKEEGTLGSFPTHFERSEGRETATYPEVIAFYIELAREFPQINIQTLGETDSGKPLHLVTYNPDSDFNFQKIGQEKLVLFINNGIHPGESDGIDATMMLFRDYALNRITPPRNTVLATIPVYNVGGALNRNSGTRVNQNGPVAYGFRGNARNFDLNRDFIKSDSKNARSFASIFHKVRPDIFADTHVSNGADYQYTLTHIFSQHNKLGGPLGSYLEQEFLPGLQDSLAASGWDMSPYVNVHGMPPDQGFAQFMDHPRYSTGYAALWNTLGVMLETHMLKAYPDRVTGTYAFLRALVSMAENNHEKIKEVRAASQAYFASKTYYPLSWEIDSTRVATINFKGFEADTLLSEVTGLPRLKYNRDAPYSRDIPYWNAYKASDSVEIPAAYLIKKYRTDLMELLEHNQIAFSRLPGDTVYSVESYRIADYKTRSQPFEGHYPHYDTQVTSTLESLSFEEGDFLIPTNQPGVRYLLETLEPAAVDSFFNWNFFDTILQQKEGFSAYVFEELARDMLEADEALRLEFEQKKLSDAAFSADSNAQLQWLYERSPHYETAHLQYPIYRLPGKTAAEVP